MNREINFSDIKWTQAALVLAVVGAVAILWAAFCSVPGIYWNPPRLAPAFALAQGLPIYATRASAAHLGWHYGPVFPIFSLPATWTSNISVSFWIWSGLNLMAVCLPGWFILREILGSWRLAWTGLVFYVMLLISNPVTLPMFYRIHVDALCVGFGMMSCWFLFRAVQDGERFLHGAAAGVALAVFTKQIAICLVPAMVFWLWWHNYRALAGRFLLWLTCYGCGLAIVFFLWFGGEELMFNMWLIHAHTPRWGGLAMVLRETGRLVYYAWVCLIIVLAFLIYRPRSPKKKKPPGLQNLLLTVALFHLPFGLWAVTKVGGGLNSVHSLNYLLPVVAIGFMHILPTRNRSEDSRSLMPGVIVFSLVLIALAGGFYEVTKVHLKWQPDTTQEQMLKIARENPDRAYFPWNPLVTIISDKKIYPFDNALFCLSIAGLSPSDEKVRATVPAHPLIIYHEPVQGKFALRYFEDYHSVTGEEERGKK